MLKCVGAQLQVTRQTKVRLPAVVMIPVTICVQLVLARAFFFPPMVRARLAGPAINPKP
jgi:hypothetical protein